MHELTYTSTADINISSQDLKNILETARNFNEKHAISGCLVYHNGKFVQTLYGEKRVIFSLLEKITLDKRHSHVNLVWEGPAEKEVFQGWHMAYYSPEESKSNHKSMVAFKKTL